MKRMLIIVALLLGLGTGVAQAQTRVGVSLSFGDPYFGGHVVIGRPYYHRYSRPYYYRYHPGTVIVVAPRYNRSHRYNARRNHRHYRHQRDW